MKRGTPDHPKTHTLAALLSVPRYAAVGILESLWHFAQQYAQAGDVGRYSDEAIARAIGWEDNAASLVSALVKAGWVARCSCHRVRVHDWHQHADQTVKRWLAERNQRFLACYDDPSSALAPSQPAVAVAVAVPGHAVAGPEPPPTPASPAEARVVAIERLGPAPERVGAPGEAEALRLEISALLAREHALSGRPIDEMLFEASDTGRGSITNLSGCTSVPWMTATRDRLKGMKLRREASERPPARAAPSLAAQRRQQQTNAELLGGLRGDGTIPGFDRRAVEGRVGGAQGEPAGAGDDARAGGPPRKQLPSRTGTSDE